MFEVRRLKKSTIKSLQMDSSKLKTSEYNFEKLRAGVSADSAFLNLLMDFDWMNGDMVKGCAF